MGGLFSVTFGNSRLPSVEESLANLREALELYFEDQPFPVTAADGPIVAQLDIRLSA